MSTRTAFSTRDVQIGLHALADALTDHILAGRLYPAIAQPVVVHMATAADVLAVAARFGSPVSVEKDREGSVHTRTEIGFGAEVEASPPQPWSTHPVTFAAVHIAHVGAGEVR